MAKIKLWTEDEINVLKEHYETKGALWLFKNLLKNKTHNQIMYKGYSLGLRVDRKVVIELQRVKVFTKKPGMKSTWTSKELELLKKHYNSKGAKWLKENLIKEKSLPCIRDRAWRLGLKVSKETRSKNKSIQEKERFKNNPELKKKISKRNTKYNINIDKIKDLYINKKMSCRQIAKKIGCNTATITYHFKNNNIKLRDKSIRFEIWNQRKERKTYIEKQVEKILKKYNINYFYDTMIKISDKVRYPDFLIGKLCIECDGERWHKDKDDTKRDRELIAAGYEILHFKGKMINKNIQKVERCILHKLGIGEHHENSQEVLFYG